MSSDPARPKKTPKGDYPVGYARPPQATKFQPGHKGKGGRPRRQLGGSSLDAALDRKIPITENGKRRKVDVEEAIALEAIQTALKGNAAARRAVMKMIELRDKRNPAMGKAELEKRRALQHDLAMRFADILDFQTSLFWYHIIGSKDGKPHIREWAQRAAMEREEWMKVHPGSKPPIDPDSEGEKGP